uniref:RNA-directed DNA polymerase, eukaryota, reverse transcriptase zinc-binding domain protein n=1 Tax=Tanacetum cinerariifolium TaxID=118510 RepID=A0A6L2MGZ3_TANCI|nr:RNA-directed DNA polymerase, eukaryota, reverse transcriptase zinc-binding domain protein [Tanacetum cinerariifolium]
MFDDMVDSQQSVSGNVMDCAMGNEFDNRRDDYLYKGENTNVDKVIFGSIDDDMLAKNEGSNKLKIPSVNNSTPNANSKMSYAKAAYKLENLIDNKLMNVPTDIDELGNEFVVFDEELINDGSRRWQLTLCGFFMLFRMRINELGYNVRRMRSRFRLKDVIENDSGNLSELIMLLLTQLHLAGVI